MVLNEKTTASSSTRSVGIPERRSTVVRNRIDALESFRKQLEGADVDLLRESEGLRRAADGGRRRCSLRRRLRRALTRAGEQAKRPSGTRQGHARRHDRLGRPEAPRRTCFPGWLLEPRRSDLARVARRRTRGRAALRPPCRAWRQPSASMPYADHRRRRLKVPISSRDDTLAGAALRSACGAAWRRHPSPRLGAIGSTSFSNATSGASRGASPGGGLA